MRVILLLALAACASVRHDAVDESTHASARLEVLDVASGCWHHEVFEHVWTARPDGSYVLGERRISGDEVRELRALVLGARHDDPDLLASLGFTVASISERRDAILEASVSPELRERLALPSPEDERFLESEHVAPRVLDELLGRNWNSTSNCRFRVSLPGKPALVVESDGEVPGMLPWTVTCGEETWTVADLRISSALARLADPEGPCHARLLGAPRWAEGLWEDPVFWPAQVGRPLVTNACRRALESWSGFEELEREFEVGHITPLLDDGDGEPALALSLSKRDAGLADTVAFQVPFTAMDRPGDLAPLLRTYESAAEILADLAWLNTWKAAAPDRGVGVHLLRRAEIAEEPTRRAREAWQHAGLRGAPEFEVRLSRAHRLTARLWFSSAGSTALVGFAAPGQEGPWPDGIDLGPRAAPPSYGLVDETGRCELRRIESPR